MVAFGARAVPRLIEALSKPEEAAALADNLTTLNGLLSNQESKLEALRNDGAVMHVLTKLLPSEEEAVSTQAGLAIASLTLVLQGRMAAADARTVPALGVGLGAAKAPVRSACAKALESMSNSRDGCSEVMTAEGIVANLTRALRDADTSVVTHSIVALANLLRLPGRR